MMDLVDRRRFSILATVVFWLLILVFVGHSITHMVGAGDTWVAMACGRHFLNQGFTNPTVEPFSANSHKAGPTDEGMKKYAQMLRAEAEREKKNAQDSVFLSEKPTEDEPVRKGSNFKAAIYDKWADFCESYENKPAWFKSFSRWIHPTGWVNQNWLTHIIFYWLTHKAAGSVDEPDFNALVWWKFAIYLILAASVYYSSRLVNISQAGAAVAACAAVFIGRSFYDIRPAGFSNALVGVLLLVFVLTNYRNHLYIWLLVPLLVVWSNLHGGYIYVFIALVPYIGTHFLLILPKKWRITFYTVGSFILFIKILFKISNSRYIPSQQQMIFLSLVGFAILLAIGGILFAKFKNRFVFTSVRGLIHIIAASFVSFLAVLFLNPYKLTNFTHTLIVSISEHAKMWRQVHEWHPAFSWSNPVGTSIPFLIALIALGGCGIIWLYNYIFAAGLANLKKMDIRYKIWQYTNFIAAAVVILWSVMLSMQLMDISAGNLFVSAIFAVLVVLSFEKSPWMAALAGLYSVMLLLIYPKTNYYSGVYIYSFLIIPFYFAYAISRSFFKKIKPSDLPIILLSGLIAVIAVLLIANDSLGFKSTSFASRVIEFWQMSPAFKPAFYNGGNTDALASNQGIFSVLIAAGIMLGLGLWLIYSILEKRQSPENSSPDNLQDYQSAKIDLSLIIVMMLTVYMALVSRRFITIAGIWVAFYVVLFFEQIIKDTCATVNYKKVGKFLIVPLSKKAENYITLAAFGGVIFFGLYWGLKFNRIYLQPSVMELNHKYATVFMRMTASNVKPFEACQFIRENNLSGNMYNYWTEGGFIAYGQTPDPNTGKTPLQLYMDGRAQAAYEPLAYRDWISIMGGGPFIGRAHSQGRRPTAEDYDQAGQWIDNIFKNKKVWVVLMPASQMKSEFMMAITSQKNWQCVYSDDSQRLYIDLQTPKGNELFNGVFNGQLKFPDEYSKNITTAYNYLRTSNQDYVRQGFEKFQNALKQKPGLAILELMQLSMRHSFLADDLKQTCADFVSDFEANFENYRHKDGMRLRAIAALTAIQIMQRYDESLSKTFDDLKIRINTMSEMNMDKYRW